MRIVLSRLIFTVGRILNLVVVVLLASFVARGALQFQYPELAAKAAAGSELGTDAVSQVMGAVFAFTNPVYTILASKLPIVQQVDIPIVVAILACLFIRWFFVGLLNDLAVRTLVGRQAYV
jgi:hypothetical protein